MNEESWCRFGDDPRATARRVGLLAGDGISVLVKVYDPDPRVMAVVEREQRMTLLQYGHYGFSAKALDGMLHACRWQQASSYCKRHPT